MSAGNQSVPVSVTPSAPKRPCLPPSASEEAATHDFGQFRLLEVLDSSLKAKYVSLLGYFEISGSGDVKDRNGAVISSSGDVKDGNGAFISSSGDVKEENGAVTSCSGDVKSEGGHIKSGSGDVTEENGAVQKQSGSRDLAILLLEKEAFPVEELQLSHLPLTLVDTSANAHPAMAVMHNDIWHKYRLRLAAEFCSAKATLVHPATERLVAKYRRRPQYLVEESPDDYRVLTEPALSAAGAQHSLAWVRNLLDGSAERDRLVHEDPDPLTGYLLHADLKWDGRRLDDLYCLAVCRREGLGSLRQLGPEHLPLLTNLLETGRAAVSARYGVPASQLRVFLHYQPSFYHLHAHFTHLAADWPGQQAERAHLLAAVIGNIRLVPDYYQRATLTFPVKEGDTLFDAYKARLGL